MWQYNYTDELHHHGIKGQKWGVRRFQNKDGSLTKAGKARVQQIKTSAMQTVAGGWAHVNPREIRYSFRKLLNNPNSTNEMIAKYAEDYAKSTGVLPTNPKAMKAIETMGITRHQKAVYNNLNDADINRFKKYTNAAWYSRSINGYLATGKPPEYAEKATDLKASLRKNKISDVTVYRSCNFKYSTNGIAKKLNQMSEAELAKMFGTFSKSYSGKSLKENRVFSTSTSPLFAIDTWRKVNPTAAATYNTYLIINCKGASGIYADGRTSSGKALVNTRSNQEVILAPEKLQYRKLAYDEERKMFAITVDAIG